MAGIHVLYKNGATDLLPLPDGVTRDEAVAELMKVRLRDEVRDAVLSGVQPVRWDR